MDIFIRRLCVDVRRVVEVWIWGGEERFGWDRVSEFWEFLSRIGGF